jgi:2-iminobutanoate/2-iminopropanoate deaminase
MKTIIDTGLPKNAAPYEWATFADGILYTVHLPFRPDGSVEDGSIEKQTGQTLGNLRQAVEAAGGTLADVTQVLIYLTKPELFSGMNDVYRDFFPKPYPNRATVIVAGLLAPGAVLEIVAYAHIRK